MTEIIARNRDLASVGGPCILVEPSDYFLRNFGDMAMLRSAVEWLAVVMPGANIYVCTEDPDALHRLCPSATPVAGKGRFHSLKDGFLRTFLRSVLPTRFADRLHRRIPRSFELWLERRLSNRSQFAEYLKRADMLVVAGMGGITDFFGDFAEGVMRSLELGIKLNLPVVMVGQGIGPLENPKLRKTAAAILPKLDLIALREKRAGPALLRTLGVDPSKIFITGDDSVQFAYDMRVETFGSGIGVNLRRARYSGLKSEVALSIGEAVQQLADARNAPLIPLPIQRGQDCDIESLRSNIPDLATELDMAENISSLSDIVRQVQRCRLVITGSYHAGVFALANGIPVLGIASSSYYIDKFEGLADMFGDGCRVLRADEKNCVEELRRGADRLWVSAEKTRPRLLASAEHQITSCRAAYERIAELVMDLRTLR